MSFYLDDDNDDAGHFPLFLSQGSGVSFNLSQSSQPSLSQDSAAAAPPLSQPSMHLSQQSQSQNSLSQQNYDAPEIADFHCHNCGSTDSYLDDTTGNIICTVCFTQSFTQVDSSQQQFDYEDAINMAHKSRDGRLVQQQSQQSQSSSASTRKKSRKKPLSDYDTSQRPPPLPECLDGFQTVMVEACRILCQELITLPVEVKSKSGSGSESKGNESQGDASSDADAKEDSSSDSTEDDEQSGSDDRSKSSSRDQRKERQKQERRRRRDITNQALLTLRDMWKAYLYSWQEGAEHYAALYPQVRFALRDAFLQGPVRGILYKTLAARAAKKLKQQIQQEDNHENGSEKDDENSDVHNDDFDLANDSDDSQDNDSGDDETGGGKKRSNRNISLDEVPQQLTLNAPLPSKRSWKRKRTSTSDNPDDEQLDDSDDDDADDARETKTNTHHNTSHSDDEMDSDGAHAHGNEDMDSVTSDLSKELGAQSHNQLRMARNAFSRMIYYHLSKKRKQSKGSKGKQAQNPKLGRKEAALILQPSMAMIMGMLCIATSSYGVTARHIANWVKNGSLPLLNAFELLFDSKKQESLKSIAPFFRHSILPTEAILKRMVLNIHVACGYRPPTVQLKKSKEEEKDVELSTKALMLPGRLIRPSNVPLVLANMVVDLGLSQKVLDYSLSMMGYPVVRHDSHVVAHKDSMAKEIDLTQDTQKTETKEESEAKLWLPPALRKARPDHLNCTSRILAVVVAACKMIPSWNENIEYTIKSCKPLDAKNAADSSDQHGDRSAQEATRFIPWDLDHFRFIGNGTREEEYLDFLESTLLFSNKSVLPNFVESLKGSKEEKTATNEKTVVRPNATLLRVSQHPKKAPLPSPPQEDDSGMEGGGEGELQQSKCQIPKSSGTKSKRPSSTTVTYRRTTSKEVKSARTVDPPLGPMIEFFAYKTGCRSDQTIEYLIVLDKDLNRSSRSAPASMAPVRMTPLEVLDAVMKPTVSIQL